MLQCRSQAAWIGVAEVTDLELTCYLIRDAAESASFRDSIDQFPMKMETIVGERGVTLSGGQKQRATLARGLIRDAQVLILDDCFSSVDTETEEHILRRLKELGPISRDSLHVIFEAVKNAGLFFINAGEKARMLVMRFDIARRPRGELARLSDVEIVNLLLIEREQVVEIVTGKFGLGRLGRLKELGPISRDTQHELLEAV